MNYTDLIVTIPAGKKAVVLAWLNSHGIDVNRDEGGIELTKAENVIGSVCTPSMKDVVSKAIFFQVRFKENIANKIPDKPNYILWRSDVYDVDGNHLPKPMVTINDYDINGTVIGTRLQGVGEIA